MQSLVSDWYEIIFYRGWQLQLVSFWQQDSRSNESFSQAKDTDKVVSPLEVIYVLRSSRHQRFIRYLEKEIVERDLSVIMLFICLGVLFRISSRRLEQFQLQQSSLMPMSVTLQSQRLSRWSFLQYLEVPNSYNVRSVICFQFIDKFNDSKQAEFSLLRKYPTPALSTAVACKSNTFSLFTSIETAKTTNPQDDTSAFPYTISFSSLEQFLDLAMIINE